MITKDIGYEIDGKTHTGYLADGSGGKTAPGILVCHQGGGVNAHTKDRAHKLADLGYVAFALDMYGEPVTSVQQAMGLVAAITKDGPLLRKRASAGLEVLKAQANVDGKRLGAIGFCFGGAVVL